MSRESSLTWTPTSYVLKNFIVSEKITHWQNQFEKNLVCRVAAPGDRIAWQGVGYGRHGRKDGRLDGGGKSRLEPIQFV